MCLVLSTRYPQCWGKPYPNFPQPLLICDTGVCKLSALLYNELLYNLHVKPLEEHAVIEYDRRYTYAPQSLASMLWLAEQGSRNTRLCGR